ncbi:DEAD/DEAH box helicase [soil metagenome]
MPDIAPLVDAVEILRLVGSGAFERGRDYQRADAVLETTWNEQDRVVTGRVRGSRSEPYEVTVRLSPASAKVWPLSSTCTCPVGEDCKHVVAALLFSNLQKVTPTPAPVKSWKSTVSALSGRQRDEPTAALGLLFELREQVRRSRSRWNAPVARAAEAPLDPDATYRLGVRPVTQSASGSWVRSTITWNSIGYQAHRLALSGEQQRWFAQFAALHRATRDGYIITSEPDWLYLDDFQSPLLWSVLSDARRVGIALVTGKKDHEVQLARSAAVSLDVAAIDAGLVLTPRLEIEGVQHPPLYSGATGDHGVYVFELEPKPRFILAETPISAEQHRLLHEEPLTVPRHDVDEFLEDYYPSLQRTVTVASSDGSVELPEVKPPVIVLTVTFAPKHTVHLAWNWEFGGEKSPLAFGRVPDEVERILGAAPTPITLQGIDAAEFIAKVMPALGALAEVRVDIVGKKLDYTELTDAPHLTIKTEETDKRDWFDLGVYVSVEGRDIPFAKLFTALSKGQKKLLLVDRSYLSLDQPVFENLRTLIEEASALAEWETGLRISRYQAVFWEELEELADETEQAVAWREAVGGLTAAFAPTVLPAGLHAELRPYQQDGFDWLAFLYAHGLGGVLADDMGLGKTLQALALIAHAKEPPSAAPGPFLVVAPTSVVSNWAAEAARFTPGLRVATIAKTKQPIPADVDLVITSYALFRLDFARYQAAGWAGLILDEAQFVKNRQSKAHECAVELDAPFKLAITGTPMENSLMDLWSLFHIVAPGLFTSAPRFAQHYEKPIATGNGERLEMLRRRIRPLMMRRTKELVAEELPPKQEQVLYVDLEPRHRKLYDTVLQKERQKLLGLVDDLDRNRFIVFRSLTLLRMLSLDATLVSEEHEGLGSSKLDVLMQQLDDVVAEGHRALVFSQFTSYLTLVAARLTAEGIPHEYLDGSTLKRADVIARFKEGTAPVFLISLKAGGFGLNLTEADYVFLLDPWWNPATETQAIDRTHRIGQAKNVMVYRLVARDTIEEKVMELKEAKARLFDAVMDDDAAFSSALTADDIRGLLE